MINVVWLTEWATMTPGVKASAGLFIYLSLVVVTSYIDFSNGWETCSIFVLEPKWFSSSDATNFNTLLPMSPSAVWNEKKTACYLHLTYHI